MSPRRTRRAADGQRDRRAAQPDPRPRGGRLSVRADLGGLQPGAGRLLLLPDVPALTSTVLQPKVASLQSPLPDPPPQAAEGESVRRRSLKLASWLSVVPGLGQLYNRQPKKAAIFLFAVIGLFFVTLNIPGATAELLAWWKPRGSVEVMLSLLLEMLSLLVFMT